MSKMISSQVMCVLHLGLEGIYFINAIRFVSILSGIFVEIIPITLAYDATSYQLLRS